MNSSKEFSSNADDEIYNCLDLKSPKSFSFLQVRVQERLDH